LDRRGLRSAWDSICLEWDKIFPMSVCGVPIRAIHVTPDELISGRFLPLLLYVLLLKARMCFVRTEPSDLADPPSTGH
jgi:hypothetical protein